MPIWSVALFGSRARGDHDPSSDTDMLLITSEARPRHIMANNISLSLYPAQHLIQRAKRGDLFVCHLVNEAKVLHDERGTFAKVKTEFRLQASYERDVQYASDLGRFLVRHAEGFVDVRAANKRIAWVIRTILIARSAEAGHPIFSPEALADMSGLPETHDLIQQKSAAELASDAPAALEKFLNVWGLADIADGDKSWLSYLGHFKATTNDVALQTLDLGMRDAFDHYV